jgi:GDP-mannose 6-dehydrogenase
VGPIPGTERLEIDAIPFERLVKFWKSSKTAWKLVMRIIIVGLGRVGIAITALLLSQGHEVIGVETNEWIINQIVCGLSPFREPEVEKFINDGLASGRLRAGTTLDGVDHADVIFVCVGTPGLPDGSLDLSDVTNVARDIGEAVRRRKPAAPPILIAFRSTMMPGSMRNVVLPAIVGAAADTPRDRYHVVYHPEFMREGSAIADCFSSARIIVGEERSGDVRALLDLYSSIDAPRVQTSFELAEFIKFVDNGFHALKVSYANEIGRLALRLGLSPSEVSNLFLADSKLNLSSSYLRPGAPFGGPCLSKDVRALASLTRDTGIDAPVIDHIAGSNDAHGDFLLAEIERRIPECSRVLLIGLSFKDATDDLRGSPLVKIAEWLLARGHDLAIYDPDLYRDNESKSQLYAQLPPRLSAILQSELPDLAGWDLIVLGKRHPGMNQMAGWENLFDINRL